MYLSVYLLIYPLLTWGVGGALMGVNDSHGADTQSNPACEANYTPLECPLLESDPEPARKLCMRTSTWNAMRKTVLEGYSAAFQPPVIASMIGMVIAVSPLHQVFVDLKDRSGDCAPLQFLTDGVMRIGQAAVPINMIILGASLAKGANWGTVSLPLNLSIAFLKLCIMPLFGLGTAAAFKQFYAYEDLGPSFYLVVVLVTCTPTANNLMVMAELGSQDKQALATCIFTQYMLSPLILTGSIWLAISEAFEQLNH